MAGHRLRYAILKVKTTSDLIDLAYAFESMAIAIRPMQVRDEITNLLTVVRKLKPRHVIEIGTANGGTLFLLAHMSDPNATIVSIDLPGGPFGGGYHKWKSSFYRSFSLPNQKIILITEDSHDPRTLVKVGKVFRDQRIDLLFIDGDHTYEGVKRDFEMYSALVRKGGVVVFHDICECPRYMKREVKKFWDEVKLNCRFSEIVQDCNQKWAGIGVLSI